MARLTKLATALGSFLTRTPPSPAISANDFQTKLALAMFALQLRMLGKKDMLELTRILTMNVADLANDFFESDAVKGLLSFDATLGVYLGPRSPNTVFNLLYRPVILRKARHGRPHPAQGRHGRCRRCTGEGPPEPLVSRSAPTPRSTTSCSRRRLRQASCSAAVRRCGRRSSPPVPIRRPRS